MKKIVLLGIVITMLFSLCGCTVVNTTPEQPIAIEGQKFIETYYQVGLFTTKILVDKETKVQYIFYEGGLTVRLDENGQPLLYESEEK